MRLWTLILALTLAVGGTASTTAPTWADTVPGEPSGPTPDTGVGDPDWPTSGGAKMPKSTPPRGDGGTSLREGPTVRSLWVAKWMWSLHMAFSSVSRLYFRF
jgi:hypothetical protein